MNISIPAKCRSALGFELPVFPPCNFFFYFQLKNAKKSTKVNISQFLLVKLHALPAPQNYAQSSLTQAASAQSLGMGLTERLYK